MAAVDYFLKIDGIEGESADSKHKNEIELESFSWGASQAGHVSGGAGMGAGKVVMQDFHFTTKTSKASPKLLLACCNGQHVKMATLVARKAGKEQAEYLKVTLSDVLVSSITSSGSQGNIVPVEQVSLSFGKVEIEYKDQKADGTLGGATKAGYDLKANKAV
ncbi:MAG: type VI secretion system tube protein Hcp [bacterium]